MYRTTYKKKRKLWKFIIGAVVIAAVSNGCGNAAPNTATESEIQTEVKEEIKVTFNDDNGNQVTLKGELGKDENGNTVINATDTEGNKVVANVEVKTDENGNTVIDNIQIKNPENATIVADNKEQATVPGTIKDITVEAETEPVTETQTKPASSQPATTPAKPQESTQASTQTPTQIPTQALTQSSTQATSEPAKQWSLEDPKVMAALKDSIVKWINYYRQQDNPGYPDLVRNFDIDKVYQVRTEHNAAAGKLEHNSKDEALIATELKVGIYVEHPSCVPMRFTSDNTMWGELNNGKPIYVTLFWEALGFNAPAGINATASTPEAAVDWLGRRIAKGYKDSSAHWNYIGGHKNGGEIAVGACLGSKDGMDGLYTAVAVRDSGYSYYYDENNVWTYYPNGIY